MVDHQDGLVEGDEAAREGGARPQRLPHVEVQPRHVRLDKLDLLARP
jgi:hypothetical protein